MIHENSKSKSKGPDAGALKRLPETNGARQNSAKELAKVTLYVRPDQVIAVEDIQLRQRKLTGKRLDKSALFQEALDLLIKKYIAKK